MDTMLLSIANLGGGFGLAIALLYLHREALHTFRDELAMDRKRCDEALALMNERLDKQTLLLAALTKAFDSRDIV